MTSDSATGSTSTSTTISTTWTTVAVSTALPPSTMETSAIVINPSPTTITSTRTIGFVTTITESQAAPVTLPPPIAIPEPTETALTVIGTYQPTITITQTSVAGTFFFQNPQSSIYSTSTAGYLLAPTQPAEATNNEEGFNGWSAGAKAGLIIGVVFAALLILWLMICCHKRNARWIAHDWRWAPQVEGSAPASANANMMHPGSVASPVTLVSTPSYSYGYPYMRGGGDGGSWYRAMIERVRLWRSYGKVEKQSSITAVNTYSGAARDARAERIAEAPCLTYCKSRTTQQLNAQQDVDSTVIRCTRPAGTVSISIEASVVDFGNS